MNSHCSKPATRSFPTVCTQEISTSKFWLPRKSGVGLDEVFEDRIEAQSSFSRGLADVANEGELLPTMQPPMRQILLPPFSPHGGGVCFCFSAGLCRKVLKSSYSLAQGLHEAAQDLQL